MWVAVLIAEVVVEIAVVIAAAAVVVEVSSWPRPSSLMHVSVGQSLLTMLQSRISTQQSSCSTPDEAHVQPAFSISRVDTCQLITIVVLVCEVAAVDL